MSTYRELVYMCLDRVKLISDDAYYTEEHIMFLLDKYRASVIQQLIEKKKFEELLLPTYYQTLCIDLEKSYAIDGVPCEGVYLKSTSKIPDIIYGLKVYLKSYFKGEITFVSPDRMKYVGHNKWLKNVIYATIGPDNYLYLTSSNHQFINLEQIVIRGIFEKPEKAYELQCCQCDDSTCDPLDADFALGDAYVSVIMDSIVQILTTSAYAPEDISNNDRDDLATFGSDSAKAAAQKAAYKVLKPTTSSKDDD